MFQLYCDVDRSLRFDSGWASFQYSWHRVYVTVHLRGLEKHQSLRRRLSNPRRFTVRLPQRVMANVVCRKMRIVPADNTHLKEWLGMRLALWPECPPAESQAEIEQTLSSDRTTAFIVLDAEKAVGFAEVSVRDYVDGCTTQPVGYLEGIFILPEHRKKGFARALVKLGNMSERDYQTYRTIFDQVVGNLPAPDLLIYLKAPISVLLDRIQNRGREMETGITSDYLQLLEDFYEIWIGDFDYCPVLTIRTDDLDFVHRPRHLEIIIQRIHDKLAGKEEVEFPSE